MAMASRILSRSKQLYGCQIILQHERTAPVRSFAKVAEPPRKGGDGLEFFKSIARKGDDKLKKIYDDVVNKYNGAIEILKKEKITIAPEDPAAVKQYANVMKKMIEKVGLYSISQQIDKSIKMGTRGIEDVRSYLLAVKEVRIKNGISDDISIEPMMMEALDKVEKEIKKPLMRNDEKGKAMLRAEFDKINAKLGIKKEDLPKYEEAAELAAAKASLEEMKKEAVETLETMLKREEFKGVEPVDVKELDIRNLLCDTDTSSSSTK